MSRRVEESEQRHISYPRGFPAANGLPMTMAGPSAADDAKPTASTDRKLNVDKVKAASGLLGLFEGYAGRPRRRRTARPDDRRAGGGRGLRAGHPPPGVRVRPGAQALAQRQQRMGQRAAVDQSRPPCRRGWRSSVRPG